MVRAGVATHPSKYKTCRLNEIQEPPKRYSIIDRKALQNLLSIHDQERFQREYPHWVESELATDRNKRNGFWSESVAVGNERFVKEIQQQLAWRVRGRTDISSHDNTSILKEPPLPYNTLFNGQKDILRQNNTYLLTTKYDNSTC